MVFDGLSSKVLQLDLLIIHMDRLTGVGNDAYFACADFQSSTGIVYDLDIIMSGKSINELEVAEIIVHKENGIQRYGWREKNEKWLKATN